MAVRICKDLDGDTLVGMYTEAVDGESGLVVRRTRQFDTFGEYRTPFGSAHLDVSTTEIHGRPGYDGVTPMYFTIQSFRMAELATREPCRKWKVPEDQVQDAIDRAVAAIELYAKNLSYSGPVSNVVAIASDVRY